MDIKDNPYKADFPLLVANPTLAFVDSAATSQRPACVIEAQERFYRTMNANALRGLYRLSVETTQAIAEARAHVARFIGASDPDEIVYTRNTSEALNLLAKSFGTSILKPGDEVCITIMEHHSNLIPWQQVCHQTGATLVYMRPNADGIITDEEIAQKIGAHTKIVSFTHVSNVLGVETPAKKIVDAAHAQGAYAIIDGAQSAPHIPVNAAELGCDFFTFSAHKAFGPFGIGVLWGKRALFEEMPPFLTGGEMIDSVTETDAVWAPIPEKFEAGTQDAAGIYATDAALTYLENVGFDTITERENALVKECMQRMSQLDFLEFVGSPDPALHHSVVSFNLKGIHPHDVASIVDTEDVAIRVGHHCAEPLLHWMGISSCCRASFALYNDESDIDKLIHSLKTVWGIFANA